ncbi:MAG TPA: hypothetical protein DEX10_09400, partial [Betaproteobacteria bacterium]|nr:hypothetical protein [Betaproteobacteria bacterium]
MQLTAAKQPQIVVNGVVQTQNEKPAIRLQTSQLDITGIASFTSGYVGAVASVAAADDNGPVVLYSSGAFLGFGSGGSQVRFRMRNPDPAFTTPPSPYAVSNPINTNTLMSYTTDGVANINNYLNGALVWQDTSAASFNPVIGIGGNHSGQTITNGKVQEVVIFNTTFSTANRQTLERNQGAYYLTAILPDTPTIVTATAGNAQATVTFTAPANNGGSTVIYTATSSPVGGTSSCNTSTLTCAVSGLTNSTAYTFTVTATNGVGTSAASVASNSVTPKATQATLVAVSTPSTVAFGGTTTLSATGGSGTGAVTYASNNANCTISGTT